MQRSALFFLIFILSSSVFARPAHSEWNQIGKKLCKELNGSVELYRKNDLKKARSEALLTHFKSYDTLVQPAIRTLSGNTKVIEREREFQTFAQSLGAPNNLASVKQQAKELCVHLKEDIQFLKKNNVKPSDVERSNA